MAEVTAVCGKICSGKTFYCRRLIGQGNAVLLSCDEVFSECMRRAKVQDHDEVLSDVKRYLHKKAAEIVLAGTDVVLDWGFWTRDERNEVTQLYNSYGINCRWHYIDISDGEWKENIRRRNLLVSSGLSEDYYVDDGLLEKLAGAFQPPESSEMDKWIEFMRDTE